MTEGRWCIDGSIDRHKIDVWLDRKPLPYNAGKPSRREHLGLGLPCLDQSS
jgi:hypothetical protein